MVKRTLFKNKKAMMRKISGLLIAACLAGSLTACGTVAKEDEPAGGTSRNLTEELLDEEEQEREDEKNKDKGENSVAQYRELTEEEAVILTEFSVSLMKKMQEEGSNTLISPVSIMLALAMAQNGAEGDTLLQMEKMFGIDREMLNEYLYSLRTGIMENGAGSVNIANSIWIKDTKAFMPDENFIIRNKEYYDAAIFMSAFDETAAAEMNGWVKENTAEMIDKIIDNISPEAVMYIINAVAFEARWKDEYKEHQVEDGKFTAEDGVVSDVKLMHSMEDVYLEDDNAVGFMKYYKEGNLAFAALLPDEGVSVSEYIASLDGEKLNKILEGTTEYDVVTAMPKFKGECEYELTAVLKQMGMTDAFNEMKADFSGMGELGGELERIYISSIKHKTFIEVDEKGTKAAASTSIQMNTTSAMMPRETKEVILDRPFVYMIVDTTTNIPVFIGTLIEAGK